MTHRLDVADGRDILARWCNLAEQRLEHLTELFETGRWRRYHSEVAFLENIQEAKAAVETWRSLSTREASFNNSAIDMSWLGRIGTPRRAETLGNQPDRRRPSIEVPAELPSAPDISMLVESERVVSDEAPSAPAMENAREPALDIAEIEQRYPLLRNAL
jgi:uncharacterized repeat protein (TIGR03809 family)